MPNLNCYECHVPLKDGTKDLCLECELAEEALLEYVQKLEESGKLCESNLIDAGDEATDDS